MTSIRIFVALTFLLLALHPLAADEGAPTQTFSGAYVWNAGGSDELNAEFSPTGEGTWDVRFRFRFVGNEGTWTGEARGNLADGGAIEGTTGSGSRRWVFSATIEDGVMRGTHAEIKGDKQEDSGTFELKR